MATESISEVLARNDIEHGQMWRARARVGHKDAKHVLETVARLRNGVDLLLKDADADERNAETTPLRHTREALESRATAGRRKARAKLADIGAILAEVLR